MGQARTGDSRVFRCFPSAENKTANAHGVVRNEGVRNGGPKAEAYERNLKRHRKFSFCLYRSNFTTILGRNFLNVCKFRQEALVGTQCGRKNTHIKRAKGQIN